MQELDGFDGAGRSDNVELKINAGRVRFRSSRWGLGNKDPMGINNTDPLTLVQFLLLIALGVVICLVYAWIGPVLAVVLGIGAAGIVLMLVRRFRPRWIKAFWAWCIDVGQNSRFF